MLFLGDFFGQMSFKDIFDILIVAFMIYQVLLIIQGTRAVQMLIGLGLLVILFWVAVANKLYSLNWLLSHFFDSFFIIVIVLFQDQFRSALASVAAGRKLWGIFSKKETTNVELDEVVEACGLLSKEKIGALIVFERTNGLANYIETGTLVNGEIHSDLLYAIFQSNSSLHDGAVIIKDGMLCAAGCFLPLTKSSELERHLGTRHRAALGISEVTDALVVTVSEETGDIKIAIDGKFQNCEDRNELNRFLKKLWFQKSLSASLESVNAQEIG
jgi:diadenylate cyclase